MEEEYYPKTKTEVVLKAFQLVEETLELNNFHLVYLGTWFFSESDDSIGIQFEYHPDNLHVLLNTTAWFSNAESKKIMLEAENLELIASVLDNLIFVITQMERLFKC